MSSAIHIARADAYLMHDMIHHARAELDLIVEDSVRFSEDVLTLLHAINARESELRETKRFARVCS